MSRFKHFSGLVLDKFAGGWRHTHKGLAEIHIPHWMNIGCAAFFAVTFVLAMSGCTPVKVKLGWKVYLDKTPIASIQASLPKGPGIAPGEKLPLVVVLTEPDGKVLQTEGAGHGKVLWQDLRITPTVVSANQKGIVSLARDPRISDGKVGHIVITVPSHPDMRTELDIRVRYNFSFTSNYSGSSGASGMNGSDGTDGMSGSMGSIDPNDPSPGGNGSDGSNAGPGGDGERGGDAPPVQVRVALRAGTHPLLQVAVSAAGHQKLYLVDPQGGTLMVKADGGSAGSGGKGGRGGRGGSGGSGSPSGQNGRDGADGRNGFDGPPGKGGGITVTYDPQVKPFLSVIRLSNKGGLPPVFKQEPVPPLW